MEREIKIVGWKAWTSFTLVLALYVVIVIGGLIRASAVKNAEQNKAIKAGVDYWSVDPVTGVSKFNYGVPRK